MGYGDDIIATGLARGAKERGKRIAFGDGRKIIWGPWSEPMFRHNPNIARPGEERAADIEWIAHYKGHRLYNSVSADHTRWLWNMKFRPKPGELFFSDEELEYASRIEPGFVVVEPNVPAHKSVAVNKDWGAAKYGAVADAVKKQGRQVIQFRYEGARTRLESAGHIFAPGIRAAFAVLARASLYIGPEGGLHHGAAAVGIPAVVLFGGFIPPQVTGYDTHTNLTGGAEACGSLSPCRHCGAAMDAITVDEVCEAARAHLVKRVAA